MSSRRSAQLLIPIKRGIKKTLTIVDSIAISPSANPLMNQKKPMPMTYIMANQCQFLANLARRVDSAFGPAGSSDQMTCVVTVTRIRESDPSGSSYDTDDPDSLRGNTTAQIISDDDGCLIEDLNSTNGVFLGERQIKKYRLRDGDVLSLGVHELVYHDLRQSEETLDDALEDQLEDSFDEDDEDEVVDEQEMAQ